MTVIYAFLFTMLGVGIGIGLMCLFLINRNDCSTDWTERIDALAERNASLSAQNMILLDQLQHIRLILEPGRAENFPG